MLIWFCWSWIAKSSTTRRSRIIRSNARRLNIRTSKSRKLNTRGLNTRCLLLKAQIRGGRIQVGWQRENQVWEDQQHERYILKCQILEGSCYGPLAGLFYPLIHSVKAKVVVLRFIRFLAHFNLVNSELNTWSNFYLRICRVIWPSSFVSCINRASSIIFKEVAS